MEPLAPTSDISGAPLRKGGSFLNHDPTRSASVLYQVTTYLFPSRATPIRPLAAKADIGGRLKSARWRTSAPRGSRNGTYGISARRGWPYSALILAARITLPHFSVSSATSSPNSAGVIGMGSPPSSAKRACNFGSANIAFTA